MTGIRSAFAFLTVLPVGGTTMDLARARAWFPVVGLVLGLLPAGLAVVLRDATPSLVLGALVTFALLGATRALHADGFIDSCDALFGGASRERRLEILRDPHVGAFGVLGGAGLVVIKTAGFAQVVGGSLALLVLVPCLGRWAMVVAMSVFRYARPGGLGASFRTGRIDVTTGVALVIAAIAGVLLTGVGGAILVALAAGVAVAVGRWMASLLGGLTGDSYGAITELTEVVVLLVGAAMLTRTPELLTGPLSIGTP